MGVPIEGEAGVGYVMQRGYNLPPVNFDIEEAEAISVGLSMISRTGDKGLEQVAARAARKLSEVTELGKSLFSSSWGVKTPMHADLSDIRNTERTIRPIAMIYYAEAAVIAA
ncbi:helix-turn-helix transcriptional regulator [Sulfitobacter sp.]|uniref:helix-turn-helix transcriptional regulator n=1 Tax=Sulfitobacter sp. TaxID=1903071 RepID=UPI00300240C3